MLPPASLAHFNRRRIRSHLCAMCKCNRNHIFYQLIYSFAGSPPGRRLPVCGFLNQPSGSPAPCHVSKARTALSSSSNHQPSSRTAGLSRFDTPSLMLNQRNSRNIHLPSGSCLSSVGFPDQLFAPCINVVFPQ